MIRHVDHPPVDGVRLGRTLRTIRLRSGRRQLDVASIAGVSRSLVSKVEMGSINNMDLRRLEAICVAMGPPSMCAFGGMASISIA